MFFSITANSRRDFLRQGACLASAAWLPLKALGSPSPDPFDALPQSVWARARNNGLIMIHRPAPQNLLSQATIVDSSEPGQRMKVEGLVFAPDGVTPASDITVYAYNTDADGYYGENRTEYPPRIYGWMKTDASGGFELTTIRPGHYPDKHIPAHIHFTVWGPGYPPQWTDELRFADDEFITEEMRSAEARNGAFSSIQPLTMGSDGILRCRFQIRLQRETNFR